MLQKATFVRAFRRRRMGVAGVFMRRRRDSVSVLRVLVRVFVLARLVHRDCHCVVVCRLRVMLCRFQVPFLGHGVSPRLGSRTPTPNHRTPCVTGVTENRRIHGKPPVP